MTVPGRDPDWWAEWVLAARRRLAAAVLAQAIVDAQGGDLGACRWLQEGGPDLVLWADVAEADPRMLRGWAWSLERRARRRFGWPAMPPAWVRAAGGEVPPRVPAVGQPF